MTRPRTDAPNGTTIRVTRDTLDALHRYIGQRMVQTGRPLTPNEAVRDLLARSMLPGTEPPGFRP